MFIFTPPPTTPEEIPDYLNQVFREIENTFNIPSKYIDAQFQDADSSVNTNYKEEGRQVWDSTSKKPVWATGKNPIDTWVFSDGTVAYSPVKRIINP